MSKHDFEYSKEVRKANTFKLYEVLKHNSTTKTQELVPGFFKSIERVIKAKGSAQRILEAISIIQAYGFTPEVSVADKTGGTGARAWIVADRATNEFDLYFALVKDNCQDLPEKKLKRRCRQLAAMIMEKEIEISNLDIYNAAMATLGYVKKHKHAA